MYGLFQDRRKDFSKAIYPCLEVLGYLSRSDGIYGDVELSRTVGHIKCLDLGLCRDAGRRNESSTSDQAKRCTFHIKFAKGLLERPNKKRREGQGQGEAYYGHFPLAVSLERKDRDSDGDDAE